MDARFASSTDAEEMAELECLDHLIDVLEQADDVFRFGPSAARDAMLAEGVSAVCALYGFLHLTSPRVSAHLEQVYDDFLRALGEAYGGDRDALRPAMAMARAVRFTLGGDGARGRDLLRAA